MVDGLFFPAMGLGLLAWLVPKLYSMLLPEGVLPLILNGALSTFTLIMLTAGFFVWQYWRSGVPIDRILELGVIGNVMFFGRLGLSAAILWAPIMLLSVAGLPRTWVKVTW